MSTLTHALARILHQRRWHAWRACGLRIATVFPLLAGMAARAAAPTEVPVRRVSLYTSGVGYFEHAGAVAGDARTELRFKSEQINDILKSLVLEDLDGGKVGTVVYPSQDPLAKTLASFQVDIRANPPLGELLNQLRGAEVTVEAHGEQMRGTILGVEQKLKPSDEGEPVPVRVLNLVSDGVIRAVELDGARRIELLDTRLREELGAALRAFAEGRDQDKKPVVIHFNGQGERRVRVGYVVETPIWKTTYRLVLDESNEDTGKLLGWAIVENQTESDWDNVTLSLVSGRPISFIQNLYEPLYLPRPTVKPELYARLTPQMYQGAVVLSEDEEGIASVAFDDAARGMRRKNKRGRGDDLSAGISLAPPAPQAAMEAAGAYAVRGGLGGGGLNAAASMASLATADNIGELFQYVVPAVTLPRQRSAMIPIVTDDVAIERMSIYNPSVLARHPLNGARVTNTSGMFLMQGPMTIIDGGAYAGDARIDNLPAGQNRLLSYAIDLDVLVEADNGTMHNDLLTARIVKGVLEMSYKDRVRRRYRITNQADRSKQVLVEHARRGGDWKLVDSPKPVETTDTQYRFKQEVAAGKTVKLEVTEEYVRWQSVRLLNTNVSTLLAYTRMGEIPESVREALSEAIKLKNAVVDTERAIKDRRDDIAGITREQERIRANMKAVSENSQYHTRLLSKLDNQETAIEKLQQQIHDLEDRRQDQRRRFESYIQRLNID